MASPKISSLAPRGCQVCRKRDDLVRCSGCRVIYYCGSDHQVSDRPSHKEGCVAVNTARALVEREEQRLRNMPSDMLTPPNLFENEVGHFWDIFETRPYMRARHGLADVMLQHFGSVGGSVDVVQAVLDHLLDMIRLCRSDNMGLRDLIPALYIRLDRDQEAYDFMKWHATVGQASRFDRGDMDLPFLDVKDADVLESPKGLWLKNNWLALGQCVGATLVKVRVLLDLQDIQNAGKAFDGTVPQEIIDLIRGRLVGSLVQSRPDILIGCREEIARLVESMRGQVRQLCKSIHQYNPHFWPALLDDPAASIAERPESYSPGTREEACLTLGYNFAAWAETPGAIAMIRALSQVL